MPKIYEEKIFNYSPSCIFFIYYKKKAKCTYKEPPGKIIYHQKFNHELTEQEKIPYDSKSITIFEIDGAAEKRYCQCLCLLAKLFLDHKTLYYDISSFMFYVLCEDSKNGSVIAGYFSKVFFYKK